MSYFVIYLQATESSSKTFKFSRRLEKKWGSVSCGGSDEEDVLDKMWLILLQE